MLSAQTIAEQVQGAQNRCSVVAASNYARAILPTPL